MKTLDRALRGLTLALIALALAFCASPSVRAGVNDLVSWGNNTNGTVLRVTGSGILAPSSDLGTTVGNSSYRFAGVYGNRPYAFNLTSANLTLTTANIGVGFANGISGNRTIVLPSAVDAGAGAHIRFCDIGGNVSSTGNVAFTASTASSSGGNINAGSTFNCDNATYECCDFYSNGGNWSASVSTKTN